MKKKEFLDAVRGGLSGLPQSDIDKSVDYYEEMIDDRMEDGMTEEEATAAMGSVDDAVSHILTDTPLPTLLKSKARPARTLRAWEIVLLIVGAPLWVPLAIAAASILFSAYVVVWSLVIVVFSVNLSFAAVGISGIVGGAVLSVTGSGAQALLYVGGGLVCIGLAILCFFVSVKAAAGAVWIGKRFVMGVKSAFVGKAVRDEERRRTV